MAQRWWEAGVQEDIQDKGPRQPFDTHYRRKVRVRYFKTMAYVPGSGKLLFRLSEWVIGTLISFALFSPHFSAFVSIPQSVPQNGMPCTSCEGLGSLHVSVSCCKTESTHIRTVEVIGSNPIAPTIFSSTCRHFRFGSGAIFGDTLYVPRISPKSAHSDAM